MWPWLIPSIRLTFFLLPIACTLQKWQSGMWRKSCWTKRVCIIISTDHIFCNIPKSYWLFDEGALRVLTSGFALKNMSLSHYPIEHYTPLHSGRCRKSLSEVKIEKTLLKCFGYLGMYWVLNEGVPFISIQGSFLDVHPLSFLFSMLWLFLTPEKGWNIHL